MKPYTQEIRRKGYLMKQIAARWGITPRRMAQIANEPKPIHWDALHGLPVVNFYPVLNEQEINNNDNNNNDKKEI